MLNDKQVEKLSQIYTYTGNITMSALKVGIDRGTASKYLKTGILPSELGQSHDWRTRQNPFCNVEAELKELLIDHHDIEAKTALDILQVKYPGIYPDSHLRTLQRRFSVWKRELEIGNEIYFEQKHIAGKVMELDWTDASPLGITIKGKILNHKLCHTILPHSKWEWAEICYSESFLSLKQGFQGALKQLGKVPQILKTDNSSTATHYTGSKTCRVFNQAYNSFCEHFNVIPKVINIAKPNENGSIESSNNNLKRKINQYLIRRGSNDFSSVFEYSKFIKSVLEKLNISRYDKMNSELRYMHKLPPLFLPEYKEEYRKVNKFSIVRFSGISYSMHSKYRDCDLKGRIYDDRIEVSYKSTFIAKLPRIHDKSEAFIDYRHIIKYLLRKPGAFENYKYRDFMFPNEKYKTLYEDLCKEYGDRRGNREYLETLNLAAKEGEKRVISAAISIKNSGQKLSIDELKNSMKLKFTIPHQREFEANLAIYDQKFLILGTV